MLLIYYFTCLLKRVYKTFTTSSLWSSWSSLAVVLHVWLRLKAEEQLLAWLCLKVGIRHRIHHHRLRGEMGVLLQRRRVGATSGEGGSGWKRWRLGVEKSLDWVGLKLLLLVMMVEMLLLLLKVVVVKMVMEVVMFKRHAVVTQTVLW